MRRRDFITLLGGAAATWPLAARAQQPEAMRRIGVLMNRGPDDAEGQTFVAAFQQAMQQLGWSDGRNMRIDVRWGANDVERDRKFAAELVALAPDVILVSGTLSAAALQNVTRTLPIVFAQIADPVGAGLVDTLARPGGNTTGFMNFEYSLSGKWLELLKEIVPSLKRAAVLRDSGTPAGIGQFSAIQGAAQSLGVEVSPVSIRDAGEIERAVAALARSANAGLVVTASASASVQHDLIVTLAARYKLPAVYSDRFNVTGGGLVSYGPDRVEQFRRAASYVDRILKGEKPVDLPVQAPTKYELVINLKTAKALNLAIPASVLGRADEVIE
jgi:putative tryptophan/tyrosine transport system substrate-binding protein